MTDDTFELDGLVFHIRDRELLLPLYFWKFTDARPYLRDDHPPAVHSTVNGLANVFGNSGWMAKAGIEPVIEGAVSYVFLILNIEQD